jgi:hypothetical protein
MNTQRPPSVTIAAILLALLSVLIDLSFPLWANAIPRADEGAPALVLYLTVVVGVAGLIGAAGLWMLRRWGIWLAIGVCVLNFLDAMSGAIGAPNAALQVAAAATAVVIAVIVVLVLLPASRRAYA